MLVGLAVRRPRVRYGFSPLRARTALKEQRPALSDAAHIEADELGLPVTSGIVLPCGASGRVTFS